MQVLDRPGTARRVARPLASLGAAGVVLVGLGALALPAGAKPHQAAPTYSARAILSGKSLHHSFTKAGSKTRSSEALTEPGSIAMLDGHLFTAFQNGVGTGGQASSGGNRDSTIVESTTSGQVIRQWDIAGRSGGLGANRRTGMLVATVNDAGHSSLYTIWPASGVVVHYAYAKPLPHLGGTSAVSFANGKMLISASAPGTSGAAAPRPDYPAAYVVTLNKARHQASASALFSEEAQATAANGQHDGRTVRLGLTGPAANEVVPSFEPRFAGDFLLDSPGNKQQVYVNSPGTKKQRLWALNLSQAVGDTAWSTSWKGAFYATSPAGDTVDVINGSFWPGTAFVSVTPGTGWSASYLGQLNMFNGHIDPVSLRGAALHPSGLIFVAS
jgi:hypothetical protein